MTKEKILDMFTRWLVEGATIKASKKGRPIYKKDKFGEYILTNLTISNERR